MSRRLLMLRAVVVVVCAVIFGRLVQLQIVEGERNRRLADENRIRIARRLAPRGNVYDRRNRLLASSRLAYSVSVIPEELALAGGGDACARLAELIELPSDDVRAALGRLAEMASSGAAVDVYLTASEYRGEEPSRVSLSELVPKGIGSSVT